MSDRSAIEWTDATWNPVRGCTKVSPGCKFCYAELFSERFRGVPGHPFEQGFDLRLVPEKLEQPLHWRRPRKIFEGERKLIVGAFHRVLATSARLRVAARRYGAASFACIHERRMVDQNSASWNQVSLWLRQVAGLRQVA